MFKRNIFSPKRLFRRKKREIGDDHIQNELQSPDDHDDNLSFGVEDDMVDDEQDSDLSIEHDTDLVTEQTPLVTHSPNNDGDEFLPVVGTDLSDMSLAESSIYSRYGSVMEESNDDKSVDYEPFTLDTSYLNWFSALTFNWFVPLLELGNSKDQLDPDDLKRFPLPPSCKTKSVSDAFKMEWNREKVKSSSSKKGQNPSIAKCLFRAYGTDFLKAGLLKLIHDMNIFVGPVVLHALIQFLRKADADIYEGILLTVAVSISQTIMSFCLRHYFFRCYLCGLRMRTAIVVAVYEKAMVLSSAERQQRSVGEIVNFMTVDAQRIQDLTTYLHAVWYSFLQIGLSLYFLWQQLGQSCLGGLAVIFVMIPLNKFIAGWMGRLQKSLMEARDARVDVNNEVLSNMKIVKLQGWEKSFKTKILQLRDIELKHLFRYVMANVLSIVMWTAVPLLVALASFTTYIFLGNELDVANALTSLALFDILRFPLFMLPQVINNLVEASVSFGRVRKFLLCDEYEPVSSGSLKEREISVRDGTFVYESKKPKIDLTAGLTEERRNFLWEIDLLKAQLHAAEEQLKTVSRNCVEQQNDDGFEDNELNIDESNVEDLLALKRINLSCAKGELVAVCGEVAGGKSSLVNCILGELKRVAGNVSVKGKMAYFPQTPFIMNDTVQGNILFGQRNEDLDAELYNRAISCCALEHDLKLLSHGDKTEIGERGVNLSGGQKARLALARCVYFSEADFYLLDDPLAAVDAHVGAHIFQKCIIDEIVKNRGKGVILVTNAVQYLSDPNVHKIAVMQAGSIVEAGSYTDLTSSGDSVFSSLLGAAGSKVSYGYKSSQKDSIKSSTLEAINTPNKMSIISSSSSPENRQSQISTEAEVIADLMSETNESTTLGKASEALMTDEFTEREKGHVDKDIYLAWLAAAGGFCIGLLVLLSYAVDQSVIIASKWWLTYWSRNGKEQDEFTFLKIYAIINVCAIITMFIRVFMIFMSGLRASRLLYVNLLEVILKAPMAFFDTTPVGRIVNRFAKDMYNIDEKLVATMRSYLATLSSVIGTIVVVSFVTPYFTIALIPMIGFYANQQNYFTKTYRELKRIDAVSRSPLYSLLGETLDGVAVIRAFGAQNTLTNCLQEMLDTQQTAYFLTTTGQCWLAIRLEMVGTSIIFFSCVCAVLEHAVNGGNEVYAGLAGLSISFALSVTQSLNWSVRMASDLEAHMISVERVKQYCRLPSEGSHHLPSDATLGNWPSMGEIKFSSAKLRYRPNLPLVLKGIDIIIPGRSKIGVAGRTGAGKSTIMTALLRLVELSDGKIEIDGVDISKIGMNVLRRNIAVIPQDPTLFAGTIRTNLDPFHTFDDERMKEVLSIVGLLKVEKSASSQSLYSLSDRKLSSTIQSLDDEVLEGGFNLSVGQRQLLVIARSILCKSKIVIMDEATASVDAATDTMIQDVMRSQFKDSTCITVAHRINTIMDSDFILVMDDGLAKEFDSPKNLLSRDKSLFKDLHSAWEKEQNRNES